MELSAEERGRILAAAQEAGVGTLRQVRERKVEEAKRKAAELEEALDGEVSFQEQLAFMRRLKSVVQRITHEYESAGQTVAGGWWMRLLRMGVARVCFRDATRAWNRWLDITWDAARIADAAAVVEVRWQFLGISMGFEGWRRGCRQVREHRAAVRDIVKRLWSSALRFTFNEWLLWRREVHYLRQGWRKGPVMKYPWAHFRRTARVIRKMRVVSSAAHEHWVLQVPRLPVAHC